MSADLPPSTRMASHCGCLMCGEDNPFSLRLQFEPDGTDGVAGTFACHQRLEGYEGLVHGGVIAALLDAAMTHCLFHRGIEAVTADLHIRYLLPLRSSAQVRLSARITQLRPPLYRLLAEIAAGDTLIARAEATFVNKSRTTGPSLNASCTRERSMPRTPAVRSKT